MITKEDVQNKIYDLFDEGYIDAIEEAASSCFIPGSSTPNEAFEAGRKLGELLNSSASCECSVFGDGGGQRDMASSGQFFFFLGTLEEISRKLDAIKTEAWYVGTGDDEKNPRIVAGPFTSRPGLFSHQSYYRKRADGSWKRCI